MTINGYKWLHSTAAYSCNCVGPQDGKPLCPCRMRGVTIQDGRYIEVIDHGPVRDPLSSKSSFSQSLTPSKEKVETAS